MAEEKPHPNHVLRFERERRGWSQQDIADKVGTTPLNVGRWERGVTKPGPYFRMRLSEIFEKNAAELGFLSERLPETPSTESSQGFSHSPNVSQSSLPIWNVPYNRNSFFTGREDILTQLRDAFSHDGQPVVLSQAQAISGLGGIGKTQTAIEYAYRYRENYEAVLWARADAVELLTSDFLTVAALLNLPQCHEQDQSVVVKAVLDWFNTHEHWLLILDNADHLELIDEFLPSAGKGDVLLTTRAYSTGTMSQRVQLEKMSIEEGVLFLLRRAKLLKNSLSSRTVTETMRHQAQMIVELVDGLPLALDQAGAYIEETGCSVSDYLKLYKTRRNRLLRKRGRSASGHPEPVATTWSLSFEKVEQANSAAAELLRLCAFLHPDEIPEAMIREGATESSPTLQSVLEDELDWNEVIGELHRYSLIKRDADLKLLNVHRLVQVVLKESITQERQKEWEAQAIRIVNKAFPDPSEFVHWTTCQQYLPHALACVAFMEDGSITVIEGIHLLYRCGSYLRERGKYKEAEALLQRGLLLSRNVSGDEQSDTADILTKLGEVLYEQNRLEPAEELYQNALTLYQNLYGIEHIQVAWVINGLALLYHTQGKYEQANAFYKQSLEIRRHLLEPTHPHIADSLNNWASLFYDLLEYEQAAQFLEQARVIYEHAFGPEHPDVAQELNNLAMVYIKMGKYEQAEAYFFKTIAIWEHVFGEDYHHLGTTLCNLGSLYAKQQRFEEAIALYQRGIAIRHKTLGAEHYEVGRGLSALAEVHFMRKDYEEAEPLFKRASSIMAQALGQDHPYNATTLYGLALLYCEQSRYTEAEPLLQRAIAIREQKLGTEHSEVAVILESYVTLLRNVDRHAEAQALEIRVQAIRTG